MNSKEKTIAILYIATGRYIRFWESFFTSAEQFLLSERAYEIHYFVFTDAKSIDHQANDRVHKVYQDSLGWPDITLERFTIFYKNRKLFEQMDFIYFFNANMLFVAEVNEEILPSKKEPLVLVQHPGFYLKDKEEYTYERNEESQAYINENEGKYYFMGGLNGGSSLDYMQLINELKKRINIDKEHNIVALWHDESHLNRYAIDNADIVKVLSPEFGYPEGWQLPFDAKIVIRDKSKYGGHDYLRKKTGFISLMVRKLLK